MKTLTQDLLKCQYLLLGVHYWIDEHNPDLTRLTTIEGMNIKLVIVLWYHH